MVDFSVFSAFVEEFALKRISQAANSSGSASIGQTAQVFSEIVIAAIQEYDRQTKD